MKIIFALILFFLCLCIIPSCSTTQKNVEVERIYVFDEQKDDDNIEVKKDIDFPNPNETYYIVQIGAFTTKERAERFANKSRMKINYEIVITYSENNNNLYLVQLSPFYRSKYEAELVIEDLKKNPEFSDVWILTVNK